MKCKLFKRVAAAALSLATVASLMLQPVTTQAAETTPKQTVINYLALGDSISEGSDSFVKYIDAYLKPKATHYNHLNHAYSGMRSKDVVTVLTGSQYAAQAKTYIQNSTVITLDIGGNDIMVTALEVVAKELGARDIYSIGDAVQSWQNKFNSATNPWQKLYVGAQLAYTCYSIKSKLMYGNELKTAVSNYKTNLNTILKTIHNWNPDCKVYIGNVYGTKFTLPTYAVGGYTILDLNSFASTWIPQINKIISDTAPSYGYKVIDVNSVMNSTSYVIGGDIRSYNIHPSEAGKKVISNAYLNYIKKDF